MAHFKRIQKAFKENPRLEEIFQMWFPKKTYLSSFINEISGPKNIYEVVNHQDIMFGYGLLDSNLLYALLT